MLTTGTSGTKKSVTESYTGVALQLALLLQGGSWTVSPALAAGGGEDQVTDAIFCSWILHYHQGLSHTPTPTPSPPQPLPLPLPLLLPQPPNISLFVH